MRLDEVDIFLEPALSREGYSVDFSEIAWKNLPETNQRSENTRSTFFCARTSCDNFAAKADFACESKLSDSGSCSRRYPAAARGCNGTQRLIRRNAKKADVEMFEQIEVRKNPF